MVVSEWVFGEYEWFVDWFVVCKCRHFDNFMVHDECAYLNTIRFDSLQHIIRVLQIWNSINKTLKRCNTYDRSIDRFSNCRRMRSFCCRCTAYSLALASILCSCWFYVLVQLHFTNLILKHLPAQRHVVARAVVTGVFVVIFNVLDNLLAAVVAHYNSLFIFVADCYATNSTDFRSCVQ